MMLPSFFDVYLCFGVISVLHWAAVAMLRALGFTPSRIPH